MVANPKLKSNPFKAENTDVSILVPEHKRVRLAVWPC